MMISFPPRGAHDGRIGIPLVSIVFVNHILLVVAIEQVDHVAFVNRKAEVGMQSSRLGNLRAVDRKAGGDGKQQVSLQDFADEVDVFEVRRGIQKNRPFSG